MTKYYQTGWVPESEYPEALKAHFGAAPVGPYPWDESDKPPVIRWSDFRTHVTEKSEERDALRKDGHCFWPWVIAGHFRIPWTDPNQGNLGTCAGFAADTAARCMLLQHIADGVELEFTDSNPYPAWVLARQDAGYRGGGATMAMVLNGINEYGRFPVSAAGSYEKSIKSGTNWRSLLDAAEPYQAGCCYLGNLDSGDMFDAIMLCVRAGFPVAFGGSTAVSNNTQIKNGVKCGVLRGSWMHATAFVAYREIKGEPYLCHMNSWGRVYGTGPEGDPASVVWLSGDQVLKMCRGRYRDAFVITYSESRKSDANWNLSTERIAFPENAVL